MRETLRKQPGKVKGKTQEKSSGEKQNAFSQMKEKKKSSILCSSSFYFKFGLLQCIIHNLKACNNHTQRFIDTYGMRVTLYGS